MCIVSELNKMFALWVNIYDVFLRKSRHCKSILDINNIENEFYNYSFNLEMEIVQNLKIVSELQNESGTGDM